MRLLLTTLLCLTPLMAIAKPHFDDIDSNGDGTISRSELTEERLRRFTLMDLNDDKVIDRAEITQGGTTWKGFNDEDATAFFLMYDLDGDGKAALWEVSKIMEQVDIFANLDFDKNDKIDKEEAREIFDTSARGGTPRQTILSDLQQGKRERGGFTPIRTALSAPAGTVRSTTQVEITGDVYDRYGNPNQPTPAMRQSYSTTPQNQPQGRSGYVANTQQQAAGLPNWMPNSVPPGQTDPTAPTLGNLSPTDPYQAYTPTTSSGDFYQPTPQTGQQIAPVPQSNSSMPALPGYTPNPAAQGNSAFSNSTFFN